MGSFYWTLCYYRFYDRAQVFITYNSYSDKRLIYITLDHLWGGVVEGRDHFNVSVRHLEDKKFRLSPLSLMINLTQEKVNKIFFVTFNLRFSFVDCFNPPWFLVLGCLWL